MTYLSQISAVFAATLVAIFAWTSSTEAQTTAATSIRQPDTAKKQSKLLPASDPENSGGWILREDMSDEFDGTKIDESKWFVEGQNGDYYIWKGRAPSQFAPHNVIVEDGLLKIRSQWEPDFPFARDEGHEGGMYGTHEGKDIPVTTGAVVSRKRFLNGYMEVRSKPGNSAMTAAFWAIGYESELDVYEQMGRPNMDKDGDGQPDKGLDISDSSMKMSVHDWQPPAQRPTRKFGYKKKFPYRLADDFHVYGCEWGEDYIKCFIDGELVYETTQEKEGKHWVLTNPLEIWLDSEVFRWLGMPTKEELPADFEIDYLRIWQKPHPNMIDRAFFGFEGPILYQQNPRPLTLKPESSVPDDYQKFWEIDKESAKHLSIVRHEKFAAGTRSLKFTTDGSLPSDVDSVSAHGPHGSIDLPAGDHYLNLRVWVDPKSTAQSIRVSLEDPKLDLPAFDVSKCAKGKWVTLSQPFSKAEASHEKDRLTIAIHKQDVPAGFNLIYIDEISVTASPPEADAADSAEMETPAKGSPTDKTKEEWVALQKTKWAENGWNWNQAKVESNFDEMDTDQDGIATGMERQVWFKEKMKTKQ